MITLDATSRKHLRALEIVGKEAKKAAQKGLWYAGRLAIGIAKKEIKDKTKKTGRFYTFKGRLIRASSPGEYPARRSGDLSNSLGWEVLDSESMLIGSRLDKEYPAILELGSQKIKQRSYLARTARDQAEEIRTIIGQEINKELIRK